MQGHCVTAKHARNIKVTLRLFFHFYCYLYKLITKLLNCIGLNGVNLKCNELLQLLL